ncbi:DUF5134 domain-containing protein [Arthrobacter sp. MA-N2]|uniref:DUF5134 domain-containing protein n=1 Tax=Arthrobacter sp. MA-N2 TaxID=1101188 RepID=UPI0012DE2FBE|nr:DUF5134 domain-containing protein [Arthrobacter sp. MA-N2]
MFNIPAITWTLTAVLLLSGSYHALQAARSRQRRDRVNNILHALMNILMAAMLWNLAPATMLAQIAVLTGAALWFVIQAVARPEFKTFCAGSQGRLKCAYHALTMAGAALMLAMMGQGTTPAQGTAPAQTMTMPMPMPMPMPATHHAMAAAPQNTATAMFGHSPALAILPTIFFGAAAVAFLILLLRGRATATTPSHASASRLPVRAEHGLEAIGAAVMALMFATIAV